MHPWKGGGGTALSVASSKDECLLPTAVIRASWDIGGGQDEGATLFAGFGWRQASGDLEVDSRQKFVVGADPFTVHDASLARNAGVVDIGVALRTSSNGRLSLATHAAAGDGIREIGAQLVWRAQF